MLNVEGRFRRYGVVLQLLRVHMQLSSFNIALAYDFRGILKTYFKIHDISEVVFEELQVTFTQDINCINFGPSLISMCNAHLSKPGLRICVIDILVSLIIMAGFPSKPVAFNDVRTT